MSKLSKSELEDLVEKLKNYKGRHTELITVYIPENYDINSVQRQLESEKATAKNIKSASNRKNVIEALEKIVRELKSIKKTPSNGLAIFSGNISKIEGQSDLQIWVIEPPIPLKARLYRCDKEFVLEALEFMLEVSEVFGLVVMDRKEATIGLLEGKRIEVLHKMTSGIPSKIRAGGQSSQRFHRITENLTREFYKRIAEEIKKSFFEMPKFKGLLIGGPIPTKDEFIDGDYIATKIKDKLIGRIDLGDSSETGLKELVQRSQDILANQEIIYEKKLIEKFFSILGEKPNLAFYEEDKIRKALKYGAVETIIFTKGYKKELFIELKKLAEDISANIEIVSKETTEGEQFANLSGIGAILRFEI